MSTLEARLLRALNGEDEEPHLPATRNEVVENKLRASSWLPRHSRPGRLTAREKDILTWIYRGKTAWEIGEILDISQRTVEWHTQRLMRKLDVHNRVQAVLVAIANKIILPLFFIKVAVWRIFMVNELVAWFC